MSGDHLEEAEVLVDRLSEQPGVVDAPEFHNGSTLAAFQYGQVVIRIERSGDIVVNGPEDVAAVTAEIQDLGDTMGHAPRPAPLFEQLLLTDYLYWAYGISVVTLIAVFVWFLIRIVGFFRRRKSTPPPEVA